MTRPSILHRPAAALAALFLTTALMACGQQAVTPAPVLDATAEGAGLQTLATDNLFDAAAEEQDTVGTTTLDSSETGTSTAIFTAPNERVAQLSNTCHNYTSIKVREIRRRDGSTTENIEGIENCDGAAQVTVGFFVVQYASSHSVFVVPAKLQRLSAGRYKVWANWDSSEYNLPANTTVKFKLRFQVKDTQFGRTANFNTHYTTGHIGQQNLTDLSPTEMNADQALSAQNLSAQVLRTTYRLNEQQGTQLLINMGAKAIASGTLIAVGNYIDKYINTGNTFSNITKAIGFAAATYYGVSSYYLAHAMTGFVQNQSGPFTTLEVSALGTPGFNVPVGYKLVFDHFAWFIDRTGF